MTGETVRKSSWFLLLVPIRLPRRTNVLQETGTAFSGWRPSQRDLQRGEDIDNSQSAWVTQNKRRGLLPSILMDYMRRYA